MMAKKLKKLTRLINKISLPTTINIAIVIVNLLIAASFWYFLKSQALQKDSLLPQKAAQKAINYINQNIMQGKAASLLSVAEDNGVYKFRLKGGEREFDSYVTRNGKLLFPQGVDLDAKTPAAAEIPKRNTPEVRLFVMSYCPFGLQAQKMFLPCYNLLKNKAQMEVDFVNYIMHDKKEIDENLRQYCIQKEEKEKYYDYLNCFVKEGNFEKCLSEARIDKVKLNGCVQKTDKEYNIYRQYNDKSTWLNGNFPKFNVQDSLNKKYGVQGSPTIVINDTVVEVNPRSPEKFKETVCRAFASAPEECSQGLAVDTVSLTGGSSPVFRLDIFGHER